MAVRFGHTGVVHRETGVVPAERYQEALPYLIFDPVSCNRLDDQVEEQIVRIAAYAVATIGTLEAKPYSSSKEQQGV